MGDKDEKERAGRWGQGSRDKSASLLHRKRQRKRKKETGEALETGEVSGGGWVGSMNLQCSSWRLYLIKDSPTAVTMYNTLDLGTTHSILGIYRLLASLRRLATWAEGPFWTWFKQYILALS